LHVIGVRQSAERRGAINMLCRRDWPRVFVAALCWVPLFLGAPRAVHAEDEGASSTGPRNNGGFPELDSKYLFGNFTRGASVGDEGERAIEPDTIANFGKRSGQYATTLTELELEYSPTRFLQLELGPTISYYDIRGVPGLNDRNAGVLNGISATIRSLLIEHGQWPFELTLSVEPEWHNFDETNGKTVSNYALETKIEADAELIKNRLFYAFNILYEPEGTITGAKATVWDPESIFGVSSALAFQVIPNVVIGADLWYLRHYEGLGLGSFTGDAVYLGPTFFWKVGPKTLVSASWEAQVAGREISGLSPLDLADFSRQRARLLLEFEF
jgi:hypothetical protein